MKLKKSKRFIFIIFIITNVLIICILKLIINDLRFIKMRIATHALIIQNVGTI